MRVYLSVEGIAMYSMEKGAWCEVDECLGACSGASRIYNHDAQSRVLAENALQGCDFTRRGGAWTPAVPPRQQSGRGASFTPLPARLEPA